MSNIVLLDDLSCFHLSCDGLPKKSKNKRRISVHGKRNPSKEVMTDKEVTLVSERKVESHQTLPDYYIGS